MTATATANDEVARYLADVAARLDCLGPEERAELLDDLEQHLLEVAAEEGAPLHERIGPPEVYAAELLASVGVEPGQARPRWSTRATRGAQQVTAAAWFRATVDYVRTLSPAWWLGRGLAAAWLTADLMTSGRPGVAFFAVAEVGGSVLPGVLLAVAGVAGSVYIGRRTPAAGGWRRAVLVADVALALFALSVAGEVSERFRAPSVVYTSSYDSCLRNGEGNTIENLFPYDAEGRPLENVLLYDQNGRPIDNLCPSMPTAYARDVNGGQVVNVFPRRQTVLHGPDVPGAAGSPVPPPAIVPPRLATTTTTTTSSASPAP
jgi:hypothetical protein